MEINKEKWLRDETKKWKHLWMMIKIDGTSSFYYRKRKQYANVISHEEHFITSVLRKAENNSIKFHQNMNKGQRLLWHTIKISCFKDNCNIHK
jgi:hypothetical protein